MLLRPEDRPAHQSPGLLPVSTNATDATLCLLQVRQPLDGRIQASYETKWLHIYRSPTIQSLTRSVTRHDAQF
jgi:hypothetical protein